MKNNHTKKTILNISAIIFFTIIFFACHQSSKNKTEDQKKDLADTRLLLKPSSSYEDTLTINFPSAVFYNPDSLQLEKIKLINEKRIFESLIHDCFFQMRNSEIVLKKYWPQIPVIKTNKARYLLFIKADKSKTCIDLNSKNDICGIFIFDSKKDPELIDMMNVDTELEFYFKR